MKPLESTSLTATAVTTVVAGANVVAADARRPKRLGLSTNTYGARWRNGTPELPAFKDSLDLLDHCVKLGAGGAQILVSGWTSDYARSARERMEQHGLYLEGQIALPKDESDVARFEREVAMAREAGIGIIRTVMLGGRRYETFSTVDAWNEHQARSWRSLTLAKPVMAKHRVKLAVENHKDWRADEMVDVIKRIDSEWIGVNLDLGNNVALLDDPIAVIEMLAPHAFTTHFKDMAVQEYEDGFLLSEVPLGDGVIDLKRAVDILRRANPDVQFNLEMITRDPLKVPVYTEQYWVTFGDLRARHLAGTLALVSRRASTKPLPTVGDKSPAGRVVFEEANNVACLAYARNALGL